MLPTCNIELATQKSLSMLKTVFSERMSEFLIAKSHLGPLHMSENFYQAENPILKGENPAFNATNESVF